MHLRSGTKEVIALAERIILRKGTTEIRVVPESVEVFERAGFKREAVKATAKTRRSSTAKKEEGDA